jgi:hypothetical protein
MRTLLSGLTPADVVMEPFPHLIVRDVLGKDPILRTLFLVSAG